MARGLRKGTKDLLDQAMLFVKSVDYKVSLRWLFYRMVQSHGLRGWEPTFNEEPT